MEVNVLMVATSVLASVLRYPAVPIAPINADFSLWSRTLDPTASYSSHWSGTSQPVRIWAELDGVKYRIFGPVDEKLPMWEERGRDTEAMKFDSVEVRSLSTTYRLHTDEGHKVTLTFTTVRIADDLEVFSRPVTYITVKTVGAKRTKVTGWISNALATLDDAAPFEVMETTVAGRPTMKVGNREQKPFSHAEDWIRCNWGYAYLVGKECEGDSVHMILAYDSSAGASFLGEPLPEWWQRGGKKFEEMLEEAERDYSELMAKAEKFDREFSEDCRRVGGEKFADIAALAYLQSFAGCKLVAGNDGHPLFFSKENSSGACMGTVDVFMPQMPLLLLTSKSLVRATLEPILVYAASDKWPYGYAPHDVGFWPRGDAQAYNMGINKQTNMPHEDAARMPVEECGNMLILLCAQAKTEGSVEFASRWWPTVTKWAHYLERFGFDPGEQLCTDDFAGHLAHNANLSAKSIIALAAYGKMCEMRGDREGAGRYMTMAKKFVPKWMDAAKGGAEGGSRLAFDRPGSWSMKYNLMWDGLLGLGLFPQEVLEAELRAYHRMAWKFGIPLDSRKLWAKPDWMFFIAGAAKDRGVLEWISGMFWKYLNETPDRNPMSDWYFVHNGRQLAFNARPTVGAMFAPMLFDGMSASRWLNE